MNLFMAKANRKDPRPHQSLAIDLVREAFRAGFRKVVLQGPVGFGKTLVSALIVEMALAKGNPVIFTVPQTNLIDQTVAAFEAEGIFDIGVMQASHPRTDKRAMVQIASLQTLQRREIPEAALVIVDECHIRNKVIDRLMEERPKAFFIGLSATPWAIGMGKKWEKLLIPCTTSELIDKGYLSKFVAYAPDVPDLSAVKTKMGDYAEGQLSDVMAEGKLVANVVETWLAKGEARPTLCCCVNRAHAAMVAQQFIRAGVATAYVDGETDTVERELIFRGFREGETKVICSVRTMTTGVDLPVSCIIDAAPTKSEMLHVQKIGRGLRINPGTEDLMILDHASNSIRLGLVTDIHHETLDEGKEKGPAERKPKAEKLPKECKECGALFVGKICPHCGHEIQIGSGVEVVAGDLVAFRQRWKEPTKAEKQKFWSMALWVDDKRGKGGKQAKAMYKNKFHIWPRGLSDARIPPDEAFNNYVKSRQIAYANSKKQAENVPSQNA